MNNLELKYIEFPLKIFIFLYIYLKVNMCRIPNDEKSLVWAYVASHIVSRLRTSMFLRKPKIQKSVSPFLTIIQCFQKNL